MNWIKFLPLIIRLLVQSGGAAEKQVDYYKTETPEQRAKRME